MNAKFLKATTFVVAGLFASAAVAQDDAGAPEVPAGPTPQEVAAQNMNELLELVSRVVLGQLEKIERASSVSRKTRRTNNRSSIARSVSVPLKSVDLLDLKRNLRITSY